MNTGNLVVKEWMDSMQNVPIANIVYRKERLMEVGEVSNVAAKTAVPESANRRDPMKFKNGDVSLDDAIRHNGGHLVMAKLPTLFELLRW